MATFGAKATVHTARERLEEMLMPRVEAQRSDLAHLRELEKQERLLEERIDKMLKALGVTSQTVGVSSRTSGHIKLHTDP